MFRETKHRENESLQHILRIIQSCQWDEGNPNLDNDVHIAWFYWLASTLLKPPMDDPGLAYTKLIALFDDFNETYYVPLEETERVSRQILENMMNNPEWIEEVIKQVYLTCDDLTDPQQNLLLASGESPDYSGFSNQKLKNIVDTHIELHERVYYYARVLEALDRGRDYFTSHLKEILKNYYAATQEHQPNERQLNHDFLIAVAPERPSVFQEAEIELLQLALEIQSLMNQRSETQLTAASLKNFFLHLPPELTEKIQKHRQKYGFLEYHGYGNRTLPSLSSYLKELRALVATDVESELQKKAARFATNKQKKQSLFESLGITAADQKLFYTYTEIGLAKMYRRLAQLVNFYFLDHLISELALRFGLTEAEVRMSTPIELSQLLDNGDSEERQNLLLEIKNRYSGQMAYAIDHENEYRLDDAELVRVLIQILAQQAVEEDSDHLLRGTPVWGGQAVGQAVKAFRADDLDINKVNPRLPLIIVSGSTDPDLMKQISLLKEKNIPVAAILTQTGGVTSHAAIVAREMEIPTIVGINNLLSRISPGDNLAVDAYEGTVTILEKQEATESAATPPLPSTQDLLNHDIEDLGSKAYVQAWLAHETAVNIPQAFFIPKHAVAAAIREARPYHSIKDFQLDKELVNLIQQSIQAMNWQPEHQVAIRSSTFREDSNSDSAAGYYDTELNVSVNNLLEELKKYIFVNSRQADIRDTQYDGSIIIQEMVHPTFSGVMFTADPKSGDENKIIIEGVMGHNAGVTAGSENPSRVIVNKNFTVSGGVEASRFDNPQLKKHLSAEVIRQLSNIGCYIEEKLAVLFEGKPVDIEWAIVSDGHENKISIFQARPLTTFKHE